MLSRLLCSGVEREGVKARPDWLPCFSAMYHYTKFGMASSSGPRPDFFDHRRKTLRGFQRLCVKIASLRLESDLTGYISFLLGTLVKRGQTTLHTASQLNFVQFGRKNQA